MLFGRYHLGEGVPEDHAESVRWLRRAAQQGDERVAEQGDDGAQNHLGLRLYLAATVPEDLVHVYMWFNLSAAQGNEEAKRTKSEVAERMTRNQIAEAQRRSREWLEKHP